VIFATGAIKDADLNIPGIDLDGSYGAADFVNWYDAHPDFPLTWPLNAKQVAVIGNGNVALDVARILVKLPEDLLSTDIPEHVYEGLKKSPVTDVHVFGRRGPAQVKFSPLELREALYDEDFQFDEGSEKALESNNQIRVMVKTLQDLKENPQPPQQRRLHLHFFHSPVEVVGENGKVSAVRFEKTKLDGTGNVVGTGEMVEYPIQAVYRAVGYFGSEIDGIPFDRKYGVIANQEGRVVDSAGSHIPGVYCTGWIKRGPVGLIGHTKADAIETIGHLIEDQGSWWKPSEPDEGQILNTLRQRGVDFMDWSQWLRVDFEEKQQGQKRGRERLKLHDRKQMMAISKEK
jgi:ferredoxin--NADP+ reductase